jgi:hypothetical protein
MSTDNSIVITLDQQYISGPGMVIVAPYQNGRDDNSDALALSMQAGFNELGFFADEIQCGKTGYEELEDGTVVLEDGTIILEDGTVIMPDGTIGYYDENGNFVSGAPGGSAVDAIQMLKDEGCKNIRFACLVSAPEGVALVQEKHADVDIYTCALDEKLNENAYIVPGLGDAGDRIFGTD